MTKRAAIVITDETEVVVIPADPRPGLTLPGVPTSVPASEQLLADLRLLCDLAQVAAQDNAFFGDGPGDINAVQRVRELLPKEAP